MTSFSRFTAMRQSKGFTLMELMVVMAIIAVLIGILVPVSSQAMKQMRTVQAQKTCTDLRSAIMMYQTEYKRFPALPGVNNGGDSTVETDFGSGLISVLVAVPDNALVQQVNRRQIQYFSDKPAKSEQKAGIFRQGNNAQLRDPWGSFYRVTMDTNYDGQIDVDRQGGPERIYNILAVHSYGPNKELGSSKGGRDDDVLAH